MKIYFDTNVADFAFTAKCWEENKKDVKFSDSKDIDMTKNILALRYLLDLNIEWNLTFGTSILMKREIEKIRFEDNFRYYAQKHLFLETFYYTLEHLSSRIFEKDKAKNRVSKKRKEWFRKRLMGIVVDKDDVEHLLEFMESGWDVFLTLDIKHILKRRKILSEIGLNVFSPLEFIRSFLSVESGDEALELLKTALHGSWSKHFIIENPIGNSNIF